MTSPTHMEPGGSGRRGSRSSGVFPRGAGTVHSFHFGADGGAMFEVTGAGGSATRMFVDVAKRIPPGPPDLRLVTAALSENGVSLVAP